MPYIKTDERKLFDNTISELVKKLSYTSDSDLNKYFNYIIFCLAKRLCGDHPSYGIISSILSSIHEAEQEFRRRFLVPLEEIKKHENGDIDSSTETQDSELINQDIEDILNDIRSINNRLSILETKFDAVERE